MYKIFVPVLVMLFTGVLAFFTANLTMSFLFPVFDSMASGFGFMQGAGLYSQVSPQIRTSFYIALYILVAIPIAYLLFRLLRRETQPQQQGYVYYPG
jgi:hypothetical protein